MQDDIKAKVVESTAFVQKLRWDIHQYPELSLKEERTAALVETNLKDLGLEVRRVGVTGVVGLLRGERPGKTLALRADMDALPLTERTGCPFPSQVPGVMHACGHDAHTAILLGTAKVLAGLREDLAGNVKFLFQPAEENNPTGGAHILMDGGALDDPKVNLILALHVWPDLPTGTIGVRTGPLMAASDRVFLTIRGKSSHGSAPHQGVDAIVATAHVVTALQTIVSRNVSPLEAAVLSFGTVHGGNRYNIIAEEVKLEGTCRTLNPQVRELVPRRLAELATKVAEGLGASCETSYIRGYPPVVNAEEGVELIRRAGIDALGASGVVQPEYPGMGAEDFAFYLEKIPGALFWLGCTAPGAKKVPLHNPEFLVDERALPIGVEVFVRAALSYLKE